MLSIYEKLENILRMNDESTYYKIAEVIVANLFNKKILSQKDLSEQSYSSLSTITKFSKSLGYSGYLELSILLKLEMEKYSAKKTKPSSSFLKLDIEKEIREWIKNNTVFVENFISILKGNSFFKINTSYQLASSGLFLKDILTIKNKNVSLITENFSLLKNTTNRKNEDINLVLLSGRDTFTMISYLNLNSQNWNMNNTFIFVTPNHFKKLTTKFKNVMIIDFESDNSSFILRTFAFNYLFALISEYI
ncbi:hypothetical protein [Mesoplasma tabanidae]|uniref:HTH rpiR-type domain-containing protein n=1 Tax=Mesoplasma tabanidae TaxID=219745 RepID=A0A2K8P4Q0_9MOLU|nr:hypothetical protein [Mesoplasma tabanidae]ATZ21676.1 hypothetical protein MTABA_v1c04780 [Mesoplasma tabanidae]